MARLAPYSCPILVGRDDELKVGTRLLAEVASGQGRFVLLSGEAGIGKSRLARALGDSASVDGFQCLIGVCQEHDRAFPFAPLRDALRQQLRHTSTPGAARLFGPDYPLFARLLPELVLTNAAPLPPLPPEEEKHRLFEAFARLFARLAHLTPLCLTLEDLHWADEASLELLHLLPRRLVDARVLVVLTARTEEPGDSLAHWRGYLTRNHLITTLDLTPLTRENVAQIITATMGTTATDVNRPPASVIAVIGERAEGNPFFIEELLHAWAESGTGDSAPAQIVPAGVRETVIHRLDALGEAVCRVAEMASVIGRRFSFALLQQVMAVERHALTSALRALVDAYLVVEEEDAFVFRHALTRDAVYGRILGVERRRLHGLVARALAAQDHTELPVSASDLGYHFHAAREWGEALYWSRTAGKEAMALHAPHAAVEHFTHGIEAAERLGVAQGALAYDRGQAYWLLGDRHHADKDYVTALATARDANDAPAALRALVGLGVLWSGKDPAHSRRYYEEALVLARAIDDHAVTARTLTRIAYLHIIEDKPQLAEPYVREALTLAEAEANRREVAQAHGMFAMMCLYEGDLVRAAPFIAQAIAGFAVAGDKVDQAFAHVLGAQESGATDCAISAAPSHMASIVYAERMLVIACESGYRATEAQAHLFLASARGMIGEYGAAFTHVDQGAAIVDEIEHPQLHVLAASTRGLLAYDLLAFSHARRHFERARVQSLAFGSLLGTRNSGAQIASVFIAEGQYASAAALLAELLTPATPADTLALRRLWLARAELAFATSAPDTALQIVDDLIATAPNIDDRGERGIPRLSLLRGACLTALSRTTEAEAVLTAAAETATMQGAHPLRWRIACALGQTYHRSGDPVKAAAAFTSVQEIVASLAERVPDERMRATFTRKAVAMIPEQYRPAMHVLKKARDGGLTRREREVVALLARGMGNRAVATTLFVSEKTVEMHITHSLRKLGLRTRAELTAWASRNGLATPPTADGTFTSRT